jgi:hypothetical protein
MGFWAGGAAPTPYPGPEVLWVNEGFFRHFDGCSGQTSIDVDYGVMTDRGFQVIPDNFRPWQTPRMLDLASNYSKTQGINPPFVGKVLPTKHLIYVNF